MKIYFGSLLNVKLWACLGAINLTFAVTGITNAISKYAIGDWGFMKWLFLAMLIDLATGVTKAWVNGGVGVVTSKGLRDTASKGIQYLALIIMTHILTHYEINGQVQNAHLTWLTKVMYEFLMLVEAKSVYENVVKINPKLDFVKVLLEKITGLLKNKEEK